MGTSRWEKRGDNFVKSKNISHESPGRFFRPNCQKRTVSRKNVLFKKYKILEKNIYIFGGKSKLCQNWKNFKSNFYA